MFDKIKLNIDKQITVKIGQNPFKKGDNIYVDGHGFDHVEAIYCNSCGDKRAMILMNILGKESKLSVPTDYLSKAERQ